MALEYTRKDNYELSKERAQEFFLTFDQEEIIRQEDVDYDNSYLYAEFFRDLYRIDRHSGKVERKEKMTASFTEGSFTETLILYDFLCHTGDGEKRPAGLWAPVNSLDGRPPTIGVTASFYEKEVRLFDRNQAGFHAACQKLGGSSSKTARAAGDIVYSFSLWKDLEVILRFYESDDEFPASLTFLWDKHLLHYIFYETVFYCAGYILDRIVKEMERNNE